MNIEIFEKNSTFSTILKCSGETLILHLKLNKSANINQAEQAVESETIDPHCLLLNITCHGEQQMENLH